MLEVKNLTFKVNENGIERNIVKDISFQVDDGEMLVSFGDEDAEGLVLFCGDQYEIAAWQVIPASDALKCALEIFHSQGAPDCIDWGEL